MMGYINRIFWDITMYICIYIYIVNRIPVVPHKAMAEVSKIGNL